MAINSITGGLKCEHNKNEMGVFCNPSGMSWDSLCCKGSNHPGKNTEVGNTNILFNITMVNRLKM